MPRQAGIRRWLFIAAALLAFSSFADAADLRAQPASQSPKIDGLLSDPVWQSAVPFVDFRMVEPQPNQDPTEKTELRILYDAANLYIGIICFDSDPSRIAAKSMAHDIGGERHGWGEPRQALSDDVIRVLLDPFQDKRTAYLFFVNPQGARGEGLT
ncbi:MAG: hypothetical protein AB1715_01190, partial [Acidobacteriota bacterium]